MSNIRISPFDVENHLDNAEVREAYARGMQELAILDKTLSLRASTAFMRGLVGYALDDYTRYNTHMLRSADLCNACKRGPFKSA